MIIKPEDKIAIYSVVIGNYDKEIFASSYKDINCDMFLITDQDNIKTTDRNIIKIKKDPDLSSVKQARYLKTNPYIYFNDYKYSLYIDGHISIEGNIRNMINNNIKSKSFTGMAVMKHPIRNCIYQEGVACVKQNKVNSFIVFNQLNKYEEEKYPENNKLYRNTVIFRDHTKPIIEKLMKDWWYEISKYSHRDQISLPYVLWKNNAKINTLPKEFYNRYFKQHAHHRGTYDNETNITI